MNNNKQIKHRERYEHRERIMADKWHKNQHIQPLENQNVINNAKHPKRKPTYL